MLARHVTEVTEQSAQRFYDSFNTIILLPKNVLVLQFSTLRTTPLCHSQRFWGVT